MATAKTTARVVITLTLDIDTATYASAYGFSLEEVGPDAAQYLPSVVKETVGTALDRLGSGVSVVTCEATS